MNGSQGNMIRCWLVGGLELAQRNNVVCRVCGGASDGGKQASMLAQVFRCFGSLKEYKIRIVDKVFQY